ncbi:MAG: hypothetical protein HY744_19010 [Deltaproteobacteria bacterium]|nr:hypothetical protein [Deltaproteobacteria bacterium]
MGTSAAPGPKPQGSPSPGGGKPPAPPTQPQKSATQPTQQCPLLAHKPCDVDKLVLEVKGVAEEGTKQLKLETTKIRRRESVTDVKDKKVLRLLATYDIIIDAIADPQSPANPKATPAEVKGRAYYHGRQCPTQSHALLALTPLSHVSELKQGAIIKKQPGASELAIPPTKIFAAHSFIDSAPGRYGPFRSEAFDAVSDVFGIIKALWDSFHEKELELRADGCGVRAKGDAKAASKALLGLVRLYRKSKWTVGIKIPPLGAFSDERQGSLDVRGVKSGSHEQQTSAGLGYYQNKTSSQHSGEGALGTYQHSQEKQVGGKVSSYEQSRSVKDGSVTRTFEEKHSGGDGRKMVDKDGAITSEDIKERLKRAHGFDIVISHNDTEVQALEAIEKLKNRINQIVKVITDVRNLFEALPQVGWKFTFEVSVFAGQLLLEWEPEYVAGPLAAGRYYPVQWKLRGKIDLQIVEVKLELSFGVDIRALGTGLVLKIEGSLIVAASIAKDINLDFFKPRQVLEVGGSASAKLAVVGYVSVLGKTIADAELSVGGGLEFKGDLTMEWSTRTFDLKGKLKSKPILLTGYIRRPIWPDKKIDPPKQILAGRDLYAFS